MMAKHKNLVWGISSKKDGSMRFRGGGSKAGRQNREKFFNKLGLDLKDIVSAGMVHGSKVQAVDKGHGGQFARGADGLVTKEKNLYLAITVADCLPIYFFDYSQEVIGLVHAGWRGLAKKIIRQAIVLMQNYYWINPKNIVINIGPHIQKCHFEAGKEVAREFRKHRSAIIARGGKTFIDLAKITRAQLLGSGVPDKNIEISQECTYCSQSKYFSYRRDRPQNLETMVAYIGLKG